MPAGKRRRPTFEDQVFTADMAARAREIERGAAAMMRADRAAGWAMFLLVRLLMVLALAAVIGFIVLIVFLVRA